MLLEGAETGPDGRAKEIPPPQKKENPVKPPISKTTLRQRRPWRQTNESKVTHQKKKKCSFFSLFVHWLSDPRLAATQSSSASDIGDIIMVQLCWNLIGNEPDKAGSWAIIYEVKIGMWLLVTQPLHYPSLVYIISGEAAFSLLQKLLHSINKKGNLLRCFESRQPIFFE